MHLQKNLGLKQENYEKQKKEKKDAQEENWAQTLWLISPDHYATILHSTSYPTHLVCTL